MNKNISAKDLIIHVWWIWEIRWILQQILLQVQIKFEFPGDLNKNYAANLYHIITFEFNSMIFHEKSTI